MNRTIARQVAHAAMEEAGISGVNQKGSDGKSYFSKHWRKYVPEYLADLADKEAKRKKTPNQVKAGW